MKWNDDLSGVRAALDQLMLTSQVQAARQQRLLRQLTAVSEELTDVRRALDRLTAVLADGQRAVSLLDRLIGRLESYPRGAPAWAFIVLGAQERELAGQAQIWLDRLGTGLTAVVPAWRVWPFTTAVLLPSERLAWSAHLRQLRQDVDRALRSVERQRTQVALRLRQLESERRRLVAGS